MCMRQKKEKEKKEKNEKKENNNLTIFMFQMCSSLMTKNNI